jgi:peptidoglycan hydrolase CwlO-like protein
MKDSHWVAIAVGALIVGILIGYGIWGAGATRLPAVERELSGMQSQINDFKKRTGELEGNLGRVTNEKLNLEKEKAELQAELEKFTKKSR